MANKYRRILLKLSGEYLGGKKGVGFDSNTIEVLARQILEIHKNGIEIGIVLGGGNFFRGATSKAGLSFERATADQIGMLATIMNSLYFKEYLKVMGKKTRVMTALAMPKIAQLFNSQEADLLLKSGEILIFAGGTGNPYFSTDTAAVLKGLEINADIVIKGTKVDGVFDKDPVIFKDAKKYEKLTYSQVLTDNLKVMDGTAIALCRENKLPIAVLNIGNPDDLMNFIRGEKIGSIISD